MAPSAGPVSLLGQQFMLIVSHPPPTHKKRPILPSATATAKGANGSCESCRHGKTVLSLSTLRSALQAKRVCMLDFLCL